MHEITFSTDDKPKLLSQVIDVLIYSIHYLLDRNVLYLLAEVGYGKLFI